MKNSEIKSTHCSLCATTITAFVAKRIVADSPRCCAPTSQCIRVEAEMNFIFFRIRRYISSALAFLLTLATFAFGAPLDLALLAAPIPAQSGGSPEAEFKRISEELSSARLSGGDDNQAEMEKALAYLDSVAVSFLNLPAGPNLDEANRGLAGLASHTPPVGENYRLVRLGGAPSVYAMVINFGLGGPAAVRIYAGGPGHYALSAKIDRFAQKDFFDSDIELVPVSSSDPVFVTISGRTDDLSTGMFSAWRFDGRGIVVLWNSDLLQQSSYEADATGFHLAYCSQVDDDHPSECLQMSRDLYRYQAGEWKRIETKDLPSSKQKAN
jgi:hypothetical protein